MTPEEYIEKVLVTESGNWEEVRGRLDTVSTIRLLHHALGIGTEAGELQDPIKKYIFYGKEIDLTNIEEELGDILWYISGMIDTLRSLGRGVSFEILMKRNIKKLQERRYKGGKFSEEEAINRDLDAEREVLGAVEE